MVTAQLLDSRGVLIRSTPLTVYLFADGGYFEMPTPVIRTGSYVLRLEGPSERAIFVYATSHLEAYFRFEQSTTVT